MLIVIAGIAYVWVNSLVNSIYGYASPLKGAPPLTQDSSRPLTSQVVLVVVDGLRYDASLQMSYLNTLRKQAARATLLSRPVTNNQTAWTTLVSGANPEINGAPLFDPSDENTRPMSTDNLFATVNRAGLTAGIAGLQPWSRLIPADLLYTSFFTQREDDVGDKAVIDRALVFLEEFHPNFLLVQLAQVNAAGSRFGAQSLEYQQAVQRCDDYIRTLANAMSLTHSVLIVVSDHGQLDQGGYGGDEPALLSMPFVMTGENVQAGEYRSMEQIDVAATIATLLGTPSPSSSRGSARLDMLRTDSVERAERLVAQANQHVRLGNVYLYSIGNGSISETADGDMQVARSSLQVKNYESAAELGGLSVKQADQEMSAARNARIWRSRNRRAMFLALAVLIVLLASWRMRGQRLAWCLLSATLAMALYHALALHQGNLYSFSQVPEAGLRATLQPSATRAAVSLLLGMLLLTWRVWHERERSAFSVILWSYGYVLAQVGLIALLVGICAWWNGARFTWYLPNLKVAYLQFATLMQVMLVALMSIPLPIVVLALQRAGLWLSDRQVTRTR